MAKLSASHRILLHSVQQSRFVSGPRLSGVMLFVRSCVAARQLSSNSHVIRHSFSAQLKTESLRSFEINFDLRTY